MTKKTNLMVDMVDGVKNAAVTMVDEAIGIEQEKIDAPGHRAIILIRA